MPRKGFLKRVSLWINLVKHVFMHILRYMVSNNSHTGSGPSQPQFLKYKLYNPFYDNGLPYLPYRLKRVKRARPTDLSLSGSWAALLFESVF
jgi:hypothetical protein